MKKLTLTLLALTLTVSAYSEGWFSLGNDVKCRKICTDNKLVLVCSNKYVLSTVVLDSCNSKIAVEQKGINFLVLED